LDVHATSQSHGYNILWEVIQAGYPLELMQFYLDHQVNAKLLNPRDKSCLFHEVMWNNNNDDCMKKAQLLFTTIPDMINHQDIQEKTPLDVIQKRINDISIFRVCNDFDQLNILLKQHGALTAQQLKQQAALQRQTSQANKQSDCIIC